MSFPMIPLQTLSSEEYFIDSTCNDEELIELYLKEAGAPCYSCPICARADIRNIAPHMSRNHKDMLLLADKAGALLNSYETVIKKMNLLVQFVDRLPMQNDQAFQFNYRRFLGFRERYFQLSELNKPALGISPYPGNVFKTHYI